MTTTTIREGACGLCRAATAIYLGGPAHLDGEAGICAACADQWGVETCRLMYGAVAPEHHRPTLEARDRAEAQAWEAECARRDRLPACLWCQRRGVLCRAHQARGAA